MRRLILAYLVLFAATGCTFTMSGNAEKAEDAIPRNRTVNSTFVRSEQFINACLEEGQQLAEVRFHTNAAYLLVSLLSLGLYVPQNVTWWCGTETEECADGDQSEDCEVYEREDD